jgi:pyruvyltransferase
MRFGTHKEVPAYWWIGNSKEELTPNFGDTLAPHLLKAFAGIETKWTPPGRATVVSIGSVLEHVPPWFDGYILGSGKLYGNSRLHLHTKTATILALRGPLTARQCPPGHYAIGDPGLLAAELVGPQEARYDLGIVPHWSDVDLTMREEFYGSSWITKVIVPSDDPLEVVRQIGQCRKIVTSSLHGLIVADSFGIPRRFEHASIVMGESGRFKYDDYSVSISTPLRPGKLVSGHRMHIEDRKYELLDSYDELGSLLRKR